MAVMFEELCSKTMEVKYSTGKWVCGFGMSGMRNDNLLWKLMRQGYINEFQCGRSDTYNTKKWAKQTTNECTRGGQFANFIMTMELHDMINLFTHHECNEAEAAHTSYGMYERIMNKVTDLGCWHSEKPSPPTPMLQICSCTCSSDTRTVEINAHLILLLKKLINLTSLIVELHHS